MKQNNAILAILCAMMFLLISSGCYAALPNKIMAAYAYSWETEEADIDQLVNHGINTIVIKGCDTQIGYCLQSYKYESGEEVPAPVKQFASWAKQKNIAHFVGLNFVHYLSSASTYLFADYPVYYCDPAGCRNGSRVDVNLVSPWDEKYWQHLTNIVKNLADYAKNCLDCRIDGVQFDFELYGNKPGYFDKTFGFEDHIFNKYISTKCSSCQPPANPGERYNWLKTNGKLDDYYSFLGKELERLAEAMKDAVKKVNPDFLIGTYPSPDHAKYLNNIFDGWSDPDNPTVIWATETYYGDDINWLSDKFGSRVKLPGGYYNLSDIYGKGGESDVYGKDGEEIYAYYVSGLINYYHSPTNWAYYLYSTAAKTNGYWIYTTRTFTESLDYITKSWAPSIVLKCYDQANDTLYNCQNQSQYDETVKLYYEQMDIARDALDGKIPPPTEVPEPQMYEDPAVIGFDFDRLCPIAQQAGELPLKVKELSLRVSDLGQGQYNFIIKTEKGKPVKIEIASKKVWVYDMDGLTYSVIDSEGNEITKGHVRVNETKEISFTAPKTGYYLLLINPMRNAFSITKINAPLMLYSKNAVHWLKANYFPSEEELTFWVNDSTPNFNIEFKEGGSGTGIHNATVYRPTETGYTPVTSGSTIAFNNSFSLSIVNVPAESKNKIWKLIIAGDANIIFDNKINPYFGLTDDPSYFMTLCCGNGRCDTAEGENNQNCPLDCSQECITPTRMGEYISWWKRGEISMLTLMQKMKQFKAGTGC